MTLHDLNSDESSLELLDRVRAKLKMYPHCHEVEETAHDQTNKSSSSSVGIHKHITYRSWKVGVDDVQIALETGDLSPALFELFAMSCRSIMPDNVKSKHPFMCQREKLEN